MTEQRPQRSLVEIYAAHSKGEPVSPEEQIIIDDVERKKEEREKFSRNFNEGLGNLGFTVTEREEGRELEGLKTAFSHEGRFEAVQTVRRDDGSICTITIVYTPVNYSSTNIAYYVDNAKIPGNHDATVSDIASQLEYAWKVALFGKNGGEIDEVLKKEIRKLREIR